MLGETRFEKNGVSNFQRFVNKSTSTRMGINKPTKEWIVICLIFFFSLLIVVEKLYLNYELVNKQLYSKQDDQLVMDTQSHLYDLSNLTSIPDLSKSIIKQLAMTSTQVINTTNHYEKAIANVMIIMSIKYGWLIRAIVSGLIMTGFSWFIIYMDSRIPGIDPPAPFNLFKRREYSVQINSHINLNYLIGALVGLLVFVCMCFEG